MTLVIGGGPAGCATAIALAQAGHGVTVLERDREAREIVCGEFLGADAAASLAALGLDLPSLGATPIRQMRLAAGRFETAARLPFPAWGLPRRDLDAALRARALSAGARLVHEAASGAARTGDFWRVGERDAPRLVLATGKHALRGHPRTPAPPSAIGLKLHLADIDLSPEVMLLHCQGGYAGLQPLPGGGGNLCAALYDPAPRVARDPAALLALVMAGSRLADRLLRNARPAWARPLAVAGVPYGFRFAPGATQSGLYRVGDQASVIPSLAGDGIAMALASGRLAAAAILAGRDAAAFHAAWSERSAGPMRWAGIVATLFRAVPGAVVGAMAVAPQAARGLAKSTRTCQVSDPVRV